jgi:EF-P beta-lysylation protein EpmB
MTTRNRAPLPLKEASRSWQEDIQNGFQTAESLLAFLDIPHDHVLLSQKITFKTKVPLSFAARMEKGNINDPLLRQVLPLSDEDVIKDGFALDAVGDHAAKIDKGIIQKYKGRVLLITTGACGIHCRYCFRRHFPYHDETATLTEAIQHLKADKTIHEVILSGGDPLTLADHKIDSIIKELESINHLKTLRIHTRQLTVTPLRLTETLWHSLQKTRLQLVIVTHINHANEIDDDVAMMLDRLRSSKIHLLNQSVLLKGVNDNLPALKALSHRLFENGILPYYLHQLDRAQGTHHFEIADQTALSLHRALQAELPGYLVPRLVREIKGAPAKTPLFTSEVLYDH